MLWWLIAPLYFAVMESSSLQATFGKRVLGIKVTDVAGRRIEFGHALGRWAAASSSWLTLGAGFLMVFGNRRRRALHDVVANTLVVDRWAYSAHPERQDRYGSDYRVRTALAICMAPVVAIVIAISMHVMLEVALQQWADMRAQGQEPWRR